MNQDDQTFSKYIELLRKRARPALIAALSVLLAATFFVFALPAVYESSATLQIVQPEVAPETLGGVGDREYAEQRLQRTRQRVLTTDNINKLIARYGLYASATHLTAEDKLTEFNSNVYITPQVTGVVDPRSMRGAEITYAFQVAFRHDDPEAARNVTAALAELFIASSSERAKYDAERSIGFLRAEADRLQADLQAREAKLSDFRQKYYGGLPEQREGNLMMARDLERDQALVDADLRDARARKDLLEAQLRDTPRDRAILDETGQQVLRGVDRLAAAQQELVAALAKYSEDHPDVRRLRREVASLSSETSGVASSAPTNPDYVQIQSQLSAANLAIQQLVIRRNDLSGRLSQVKGAIYASPAYEKEYTNLVRDYELVKVQYEQIRGKQATAELSQKAAGAEAAETYVLVDAARVPTSPIEPDRTALMFLGLVLSIAVGLGVASLLNATDSTIRGTSDIVAIYGSQPLGHVPLMPHAVELRQRRVANLALGAGAIAALAMVIYSIVS